MSTHRPGLFIALVGFMVGCGSTVAAGNSDAGNVLDLGSPIDVGGRVDVGTETGTRADVTVDVTVAPCPLPFGGTCAAGATCPAGDNCNRCTCPATGGVVTCTAKPCVAPTDGGVPGCARASDCGPDRECRFTVPGCGVRGTCGPITDCAAVQPYCDCDGATFAACPSSPDRAWVSRGACAVDGGIADAGPSPDAGVCGGASIGRGGGYCAGPADGPLPLSCCTGWNCDQRMATCERLPPPCAAGQVPLITLGCYGSCVPATNCAPIACGSGCPAPWTCDAATGNCRYPN